MLGLRFLNNELMEISEQLNINFYTRYLMLNGEVTMPGVGTFELNRLAARYDVNTSNIIAPSFTVRFHSNKKDISSSQSHYMMRRLSLTAEELAAESSSFAEMIMGKLQLNKALDWPGVGRLTYSDSGSLYFEGIRFDDQFLKNQPFISGNTADSISEKRSSELLSVDDNEQINGFLEDVISEPVNNRWKLTSLLLLSLVVLILLVRLLYGSFTIQQPRFDPIKTTIPPSTYKTN